MEKYKTMTDFGGVGVRPILDSIVTAVPIFFPVILFFFWVGISGVSYFSILKLTGKKRIWHCLTASSFSIFLASLLIAGMNTTSMVYLEGYWIGFYIMATLISWYMLSNYK